MSLFRVYVDGALFYHPQMSKLAITDARIQEDAENIDSMTLSAPFNHPYLSAIRPLASTIVCKKGDAVVFEGRALDNGIVKSGMSTDRDSDDSNCPVSGECPKNDNPTNYPIFQRICPIFQRTQILTRASENCINAKKAGPGSIRDRP